jgi:putative ABC transport system substrate-binding protein
MLGTLPALRAKQAVEGMDIPVIFAPAVDPVEQGLVESIRHPGGNVTGIQAGNTFPKALEWFYKVVPQATKIHIFYNPEDAVSISSIAQLPETAQALGFELSLHEMHAREEVVAAIEALPKDEAIFFIPTPSLEPTGDLIQLALKHGIVAGSSTSPHLEAGALVTYGTDIVSVGKQAARLVDQVFQGTAAGDLPVETSEASLSINLKTAEALSLNIPDEILRQADTIIR